MGLASRTLVIALLSVLVSGCRTADEAAARASAVDGPELVVLVVIDQLRTDMLDHYETHFTGGLRRLIDRGYRFPNGTHDHAGTYTAPGHTSLATGVYPTRHGIVGNEWWELRSGEWQEVYSMEDPEAAILGYPAMAGRSSANMYRGGLPDWIAEASPDARVVSISRKDRSAIGMAGQVAGEVYWMDDPVAGFITSTHYKSEYPGWIERFNDEVMPEIFSDTVWESRVPEEAAQLSRPDTSNHERGGRRGVFPYRPSQAAVRVNPAALTVWRSGTPAPDAAVLGLAEAAIAEFDLGQRDVVDYLAVSFSQVDRIGHRYGPWSREQLDNLLHLDAVLAELFELLDDAVGSEGWVAGFSSDHGILEVPEHLAETGVDAKRLGREEITAYQRAVLGVVNGGARGEALARAVKAAIEELPFVGAAYTLAEVEDAQARPDSFAVLFARSLSTKRAVSLSARYGVYHRWRPNYFASSDVTTHGTPYYYDRSVPIIFLGAGVEPGVSQEAAATVDVAATLARLAEIAAPTDLDGRVLLEPSTR